MKKLIAALVSLLALAPVMAYTDILTQMSSSGVTSYNNVATVSGYDWSESSNQVTAVHQVAFENTGSLGLVQNLNNPGQWELHESLQASGSGSTSIVKDVAWWTEDSTVKNGVMKYPTVTSIYTGFMTDTMTDETEVHNTADATTGSNGEFSFGRFLKNYDTSDNFNFVESTGFGMELDCNVALPSGYQPPVCGNGFCD